VVPLVTGKCSKNLEGGNEDLRVHKIQGALSFPKVLLLYRTEILRPPGNPITFPALGEEI